MKDLCYICNKISSTMRLHVFNPEHDIALAFNRRHLTMPHAAQELRMNLGWIPALWASEDDRILVDDVAYAEKAFYKFKRNTSLHFIGWDKISEIPVTAVDPWGWDITLHTSLVEHGLSPKVLPTVQTLSEIRRLSSRYETLRALEILRDGVATETCGESRYLLTERQVKDSIREWGRVVLKAPWSSSGRGIRYVCHEMTPSLSGWVRRILQIQGGVMAEPYYNKVRDFGMEFYAREDGQVDYLGLSVFETVNHAYTGNLLANEEEKELILGSYVPLSLINTIKSRICEYFSSRMRDYYTGPFGIDMMIVARPDRQGFLLHPCVEINVRRTMGHVALSLSPSGNAPVQLMRIEHDVNYRLKVTPCP